MSRSRPPAFRWRAVVLAAATGFCCSCASGKLSHPFLPDETAFNARAGQGDNLYLTLRLADGTELPFILVDTGSPKTILDRSVESKLGKPLTHRSLQSPWYGKTAATVHRAPELYLGQTRLLTGDSILVADFSKWSPGWRVKGILGMDCLRHYCVQFDFDSGAVRFLDPNHLDETALGKPFRLETSAGGVTMVGETLIGVKGAHSFVDTGLAADGAASEEFLRQLQRNQEAVAAKSADAVLSGGTFGGETYSDLILQSSPDRSFITGLRFLGRHVVTLNFPGRKMYLKRVEKD